MLHKKKNAFKIGKLKVAKDYEMITYAYFKARVKELLNL
jgi:hypothetical protein